MGYSYILIYLFLIFHSFLHRSEGNFKFYLADYLKGYKCLDENISFKMASSRSKSACAHRCWMDLTCSSIIYYPDTGNCTGCTSFTGVADLLQSNSVFYKKRGYQYIGCYNDKPRILADYNYSPSQSTENCLALCRNKGLPFSMTEYANECWCGANVNFAITEKIPESRCNMTCVGNTSQKCGGSWSGNLYRTGV
ncbi:uncharacterized protein LOC132713088 [Ruditapes philippinarum]|uniref:uncharacterized protein LOC132713088 n=1 Tax=Ruditapes philippinarum TaxID=129788 RepID=UPI00295BA700|nr:uncharacterized protein LOC132713088 [Ruditapes philippinarum]